MTATVSISGRKSSRINRKWPLQPIRLSNSTPSSLITTDLPTRCDFSAASAAATPMSDHTRSNACGRRWMAGSRGTAVPRTTYFRGVEPAVSPPLTEIVSCGNSCPIFFVFPSTVLFQTWEKSAQIISSISRYWSIDLLISIDLLNYKLYACLINNLGCFWKSDNWVGVGLLNLFLRAFELSCKRRLDRNGSADSLWL